MQIVEISATLFANSSSLACKIKENSPKSNAGREQKKANNGSTLLWIITTTTEFSLPNNMHHYLQLNEWYSTESQNEHAITINCRNRYHLFGSFFYFIATPNRNENVFVFTNWVTEWDNSKSLYARTLDHANSSSHIYLHIFVISRRLEFNTHQPSPPHMNICESRFTFLLPLVHIRFDLYKRRRRREKKYNTII